MVNDSIDEQMAQDNYKLPHLTSQPLFSYHKMIFYKDFTCMA